MTQDPVSFLLVLLRSQHLISRGCPRCFSLGANDVTSSDPTCHMTSPNCKGAGKYKPRRKRKDEVLGNLITYHSCQFLLCHVNPLAQYAQTIMSHNRGMSNIKNDDRSKRMLEIKGVSALLQKEKRHQTNLQSRFVITLKRQQPTHITKLVRLL